jgi:tape measure domain-containing protein
VEGGDLFVSTIDERIVSMQFQGDQFLSGVQKSLAALDKLNTKLKMEEGTKGLTNVGAAAEGQAGKLSRIGDAVEGIAGKFKSLNVIAIAALSTITSRAVLAGQQMLSSFTFKPIIDGFREYETTINSVQTILSNTAAAGTKISDVNKVLLELNHYADQTIYNFSEMAKNIGTFTAAGVDLKTSVDSIKGIANLAALSGSNSQQASTAMYQLSQAISAGRVSLEDWNSVVNAGMGGTVFQRALAQTAEKMGTLDKGAVKLTGSMKNVSIGGKSFRESITAKPGEKSWLTSDVLTKTLAQFTGDLSDAELKAEGFNKTEIEAIQNQARMAKQAATQVKTFSQLVGTLGEAVGSGWSQTWQTIFGDFDEARTLFTNVSNVLGGFVNASANARNKVLADWKALGGRTAIINAISNAFKALVTVVKPIRDAFRQIFPAVTGKQLADMSKSLESFTKNLSIGGTTANNLKRTFAGLFAILDIGWQIIKQVVKTILDLAGVATEGSGGILNFTGSIGDFLVKLDTAIKKGDDLSNFFKGLGKFIAGPIKLIKTLGGYLLHLFDGFEGNQAADKTIKALGLLGKLGNGIGSVWSKLGAIFRAVWKTIQPIVTKVASFFQGLAGAVSGALSGVNFDDFLHTVNTGLFAGLVLLLKKFVDRFTKGGGDGEGFLDGIKSAIEGLTGTLEQMQNVLKAATLLEIAAAVALLTVSLVALSKLDAQQLAVSLSAITVMFSQLIGAMVVLQKFTTGAGAIKLPLIAAGFIILAAAVDILAIAVTQLAKLDWNELAKGLTGVVVILGALVAVAHLMPNKVKMINASIGMIAMAAAVKILASAVADLSGMSWGDLVKGLVGVGLILGGLALFTKFAVVDKGGITTGAGLLLMAAAIKVIASAIGDLAALSWGEVVKGLVTMAGALVIITGAVDGLEASLPGIVAFGVAAAALLVIAKSLDEMGQMSWGEIGKAMVVLFGSLTLIAAGLAAMEAALPGAAALIVAAGALLILGNVMVQAGGMSWMEIGKAMVVLAGSLTLLSAALIAMEASLPGAAALIVAAGALAILAPVMVILGGMSWGAIIKSIVALAGALIVIGTVTAVLGVASPLIAAFAVAVGVLGVAMLAAGIGVAAFGIGLTLIAASGAAAAGALIGILDMLIGAVPKIIDLIGKLLASLLDLVINLAPKFAAAFNALLGAIVSVIATNTPKINGMILSLLTQLLESMLKYVPRMVDAGSRLIIAFLNGIAKNAGKMVSAATNVIVAFINGISKNLPRIINAGLNLIVNFVNGLANGIRSHTAAMQAAGRNLASAIIDGMTGGLASGVGRIVSEARSVASSALNAAKSVLGIHSPSKEFYKIGAYVNQGFAQGLRSGNKSDVDSAFNSLKSQLSSAMQDSQKDVESLTAKLKKLENARKKDRDAINSTKKALAEAKKEHAAELKAYNALNKSLTANHNKLDALATQYATLTDKIKSANDALQDAIKTRDDYNKQIVDQYSKAAAPAADQSVADYLSALTDQVRNTKTFANAVTQLRALGLNDDLYQQILSAGIDDLPFVQDLLAGGKGAITQINALQSQLDATASSLGKTASTQLYQAAVDSAQGLVDGLKKQQAAIQAQMNTIAAGMVSAIKKALGIKSPSRVFREVGNYSGQGLAEGLANSMGTVNKSAEQVATSAVVTLQKSLSDVSKMTISELDLQPKITPVLDLSDIQKNSSKLDGMLSKATLSTVGAYSGAQSVSDSIQNTRDSDSLGSDQPNSVIFTQNNYSPKAISAAETYRNTNNQISKAKKALQGGG